MSTVTQPAEQMPVVAQPAEQIPVATPPVEEQLPEQKIYGHSNFFYWWPVWVSGYLMAIITRMSGSEVPIPPGSDHLEWIHASKNLGVIYTLVFFLVILTSNITLRGMASVIAILTVTIVVLLAAYFGWWDNLLQWGSLLSIHMNMGFYVFFSTIIFLVWAGSVFFYDRLTYWVIRPGQIVQEHIIGGAQRSYDTHGMVFEKKRQDLFRHWVLGFGSADLYIATTGARPENFVVPNVLFASRKVQKIQRMISERPTQAAGLPPIA